ncbi:MAG: flagellar hook-basal body complex protein [Micrococcus sp.]|nr:flagellar hook-basal body complex protein [Micrococcus sp.]
MLRSLNTGVSGMSAHQQMLDTTANNIANVNTTGFKASAVTFQDTLSQMEQNAGAPGTGLGGTNPAQVGLGVRTAAITTDQSAGAMMSTGRATDLMIGGNGFFVVSKGDDQLYTRAGGFSVDAAGNLVTADGAQLNGWTANANGVVEPGTALTPLTIPTDGTIEGFSIAQDGTINGVFANGDVRAIGQVALASFTNPSGLEKVGASGYRVTANSGQPALGAPGENGFGALASGILEGSNTDLSKEFTNLIMAQRGFQASARIVTTSDEVLSELTNLKR